MIRMYSGSGAAFVKRGFRNEQIPVYAKYVKLTSIGGFWK